MRGSQSQLPFRAAELSDAAVLGTILRSADRLEIQAAVGRDPTDTLREGIASSIPCWAVLAPSGAPMALFGVVPDAGATGSGMVWLLGSDELTQHRFAVLRGSHVWVARLHERYDRLWNYVDARNDLHINWLRWCGFRFVQLVERHGVEQRPFWRVERTHSTGTGAELRHRGGAGFSGLGVPCPTENPPNPAS